MTRGFDLDRVPTGTKAIFDLDVAPLTMGPMLQLPLLIARGANPGKTIVVLAGVHGDEYEGMWAARELFKSLDPAEMSGNVVSVPVCNPPAFAARNRESPLDGQNLARVFPGDSGGTMTERIALPFKFIRQKLEARADLSPLDALYMLERSAAE